MKKKEIYNVEELSIQPLSTNHIITSREETHSISIHQEKESIPKLRAAIYGRCCSREGTRSSSLEKQLKEARDCVRKMGWTLVDEYAEYGSGNTVKGRSEYSRLLGDMEHQAFDIIVARSQDRLTIKVKHWFQFLDCMESKGIKLYLYHDRKFFTSETPLIKEIKEILHASTGENKTT